MALSYATRTIRPAPQTAPASRVLRTPVATQLVRRAAAPLPHRLADVPAVQRTIKTKDGKTYTKPEDLGNVQLPDEIKTRLALGTAYLAQTKGDVLAWADGAKTAMLSPHRHLVGEQHDESRFESDVIPRWGWGATVVSEALSDSPTVKGLRSTAVIGTKRDDNPYYGAKALENLSASMMQGLSVALEHLRTIRAWADTARSHADEYVAADSVSDGVKSARAKDDFKKAEAKFTGAQAGFKAWWNDHVGPDLKSFDVAGANARKAGPGNTAASQALYVFGTATEKIWGRLGSVVQKAVAKPYDLFSSWKETATALRGLKADANAAWTDVDDLGKGIVELAKTDIAAVLGQSAIDPSAVWAQATSGGIASDPLTDVGPLREAFMAHHINAAAVPAVVEIGETHVTNLTGKITDGKYHKDYAAFAAALKT